MQQEEKRAFVHQVFESIAKDYDRMNSIISFGRHRAWRKYTMKKMGVKAGEHAIDVACGTADWAIELGKQVGPTGHVVGLDFSEQMLTIAKEKVKQEHLEQHVELVLGDAMKLPFPDNTFDYATIGFALRNVPDIQQVLSEMVRVVRPGGKIVSLEVSKPPKAWFRSLFYFYFYNILPLMGKLFVKKYDEYKWLPTSLTNFPDSVQLRKMFENAGMKKVEVKLFSGGVAAMHLGTKPADSAMGSEQ